MDSNALYQCFQPSKFGWDEKLAARLFLTIQQKIHEVPLEDKKDLLEALLKSAHKASIESMLDNLFDHFVQFLGLSCFLSLKEQCTDHEFLNILIRKINEKYKKDSGNGILKSLQCSGEQWSAFVAIIEGLKVQEPYLAARVLEKELPQLQLMSGNLGIRWLAWLRILCVRLLQDNRVAVRRTVLKYFLNHLSVAQLSRFSLLPEFVNATNTSQLFDPRYYNMLNEQHLKNFLANGKVEVLLEYLGAVSWQSLPLLHWLNSINSKQVKSIPRKIIALCLRVRSLENNDLRGRAQAELSRVFKIAFDNLPLREFMIIIESLYKKGDSCYEYDRLKDKISKCSDFENQEYFNKNGFEIFFNYGGNADSQDEILDFLINGQKRIEKFGFWRLVLYNHEREMFNKFYQEKYQVDISLLQKGAKLKDMQRHLLEKLNCQTSEEISFLKARCVDLFICNLSSWRQLEELNLDPLELLREGTDGAIIGLAKLLKTHDKRLEDENILPALIASVRRHKEGKSILAYADSILTPAELELILPHKHINLPKKQLSSNFYINLLLQGEATKEIDRIEAVYAYMYLDIPPPYLIMTMKIKDYIHNYNLKELGSQIFKELLKVNGTLSMQHPNYTEHDEVDRQKRQIAFALIEFCNYYDYGEETMPIESLLLPNDQLSLNLMHEFLLGRCAKTIDWALEKLTSMEPRTQVSYLSIVHIFIIKNSEELEYKKLFEISTLILPLTTSSNDYARTLAQLILHKLAVKFKEEGIEFPKSDDLKKYVEDLWGEELNQLKRKERRLRLPQFKKNNIFFDVLF